jgi:signal transduction histidine kinase
LKNSISPKSLREKAEEELRNKKNKKTPLSEADSQRLIHELEVHQIELEMQNMELVESEERSRKATEQYTSLYDFAPMGYFTLDQDCRIKNVNLSGALLVGTERYLLQNNDFRIFISSEYKDTFNDFFEQISGSETKKVCKLKLNRIDQSSVVVHVEGVVSIDTRECSLTLLDITQREIAEEKLKEYANQLRELNATKDKFFTIIAHDLKSPFTAIIGYAELLDNLIENKDYKKIGEYADIIRSSSWLAMNLLSNLLEWARSQVGIMFFKPRIIEIAGPIYDTKALLSDSASKKSIEIKILVPEQFTVYADMHMIKTILRNLLSNAIKFTNPGGWIQIEAGNTDSVSVISVTDNGIGIKKDSIEKLFRIEECRSTTGTRGEQGTGLGLLLCNDFVKKHGGKIWVESEEGKGSRFVFTLPMHNEMS